MIQNAEVCTHHVVWGQEFVVTVSLGSHGAFDVLDGPSLLATVLEPTPFDACKAV
jgi:hypothetical protein